MNELSLGIVVVTGASSGIGQASAHELARRGFHVLATIRKAADADRLGNVNIEPFLLDITDEAGIAALAKRIADDPQRRPLRGLINNAGVGMNAPVETLPLADWRRLFEINLFGHVAMIQALLPMLIESAGTVVNISSVGGKVAMAGYGPYAATKFGMEAISDSLRREVAPLGVKVVVIEPGAVVTEMLERVDKVGAKVIDDMTPPQRSRYAAMMQAVVAQAQAAVPRGASAEQAGKVVADAVTSRRPKTRYTIGRDAAIIVRMIRFISDRSLDRLLAAGLKPYRKQAS